MVHQIPDPPKEEPALTSPADLPVILATDSEDEDETPYAGYTMLSSDPNDDQNASEDEDLSIPNVSPVEPSNFDNSTIHEKIALWSSPSEQEVDMSREQSDAVLKAMEGFNLPSSAIPPWAVDVGDDVWKNHLLEKIRKTP